MSEESFIFCCLLFSNGPVIGSDRDRPMTEGAARLVRCRPFFTFLSFPIKLSTTQSTGLPLHFLVVGYVVNQFLFCREPLSESLALATLSLTPQSTADIDGRRRSAIRTTRVTDIQRSAVRDHPLIIFFGRLSHPGASTAGCGSGRLRSMSKDAVVSILAFGTLC